MTEYSKRLEEEKHRMVQIERHIKDLLAPEIQIYKCE